MRISHIHRLYSQTVYLTFNHASHHPLPNIFLMKKHPIALALFSAHLPQIATAENLQSFSPLLAETYQEPMITEWSSWFISEKLDGIRAIWTGSELVTRQGNRLYPPAYFTDLLPKFSIEGELWAGRGEFNQVMRTVLDKTPDIDAWKNIRFMAFDLPRHIGSFQQRLVQLKQAVAKINHPQIQTVEQFKATNKASAYQHLQNTIAQGGEGIMLRDANAVYVNGRDNSLLKVKIAKDAEAKVIAHLEGKGKFKGMLGAILVEMDDGKQFKIGTGFSNDERKNPPTIGALVTYQYNGYTVNGIPKFARFLREDKSKSL